MAGRVLEVIMGRDLEAVIAGTSEEEKRAETMVALARGASAFRKSVCHKVQLDKAREFRHHPKIQSCLAMR